MRKLFYILFFTLLSSQSFSQSFADKKYYLVDSLNLEALAKEDRQLIDSCLKVYHNTTIDTNKLKAIEFIVESSWDENVWPKYNQFAYQFLQNLLKIKYPKAIMGRKCMAKIQSICLSILTKPFKNKIPKSNKRQTKSFSCKFAQQHGFVLF